MVCKPPRPEPMITPTSSGIAAISSPESSTAWLAAASANWMKRSVPPRLLAVHVVERVEALDLASDMHAVAAGVETRDLG